jgi:predicted double-glycine peptidase
MKRLCIAAALACAASAGYAERITLPADFVGAVSVPVTTLKELRSRGTLLQQYDYSCGSAAVATLLTYHYMRPVSEQQVFRTMYAAGNQEKIRKEGFSLLDMKRYLEANGYQADGVRASLDDLAKVGIPAIVLIKENGYAHFVVIKGIRGDDVLVGDPAAGLNVYALPEFEKLWSNGILFVVRSNREVARRHFNLAREWSARPRASMSLAVGRDGLSNVTLLRHGALDF